MRGRLASKETLAWQLSNTLDGYFCQDVLQQALKQDQPEIFNTDQGAQFTAHEFSGYLEKAEIRGTFWVQHGRPSSCFRQHLH